MTPEQQQEAIRKLYTDGYTDLEIARLVGLKHYRIGELRKKMGLVKKNRKWAYAEALKYVGRVR